MSESSTGLLAHARLLTLISVITTLLFLVIAAALSIVILAAGGDGGSLEDFNVFTLNTSRLGQDVLANSTLFNLNETNPIYTFVTGIRIGNSSNTTSIAAEALGSYGVDPKEPILEPALRPLLNAAIKQVFNQSNSLLSLAAGSPLPALVTNATDNALAAADDNLHNFLQNTTDAMVKETWQDFASFLRGGGAAAAAKARRSAASQIALAEASSFASPTPTTTPSPMLKGRDVSLDSVEIKRRDLASVLDSGLSAVGSQLAGGSSSTKTASSSTRAASSTSTSGGNDILGSLIDGSGVQSAIQDAFAPVFYNVLKTVVAGTINSALQEVTRVFNANSSDPQAERLKGVTGNFSTQIRDMANADISSIANSSVVAFGIPDFYSAHLSKYCYGNYVPTDPLSPGESIDNVKSWKKDVKGCAHLSSWKTFDISVPLQRRLNQTGSNVILPPMYLPDGIRNNVHNYTRLTTTVYALQIVGVVFIFLSLATCAILLLWRGPGSTLMTITEFASLAFMTLAGIFLNLTATLVTTVVLTGKGIISQIGPSISLAFYEGNSWLALSWVSCVFTMLSGVIWGIFIYIRRKTRAEGQRTNGNMEKSRRGYYDDRRSGEEPLQMTALSPSNKARY